MNPLIPRVAGLVLVLGVSSALAQPSPQVRVGDHPGFGRIVFDWSRLVPYRVAQEGDRVRVEFSGMGQIPPAPRLPRNVRETRGGMGEAVLTLVPGAIVKHMRVGNRVVLDVLNPDAASARRATEQPDTSPQTTAARAPAAPPPASIAPPPAPPASGVAMNAPPAPAAGPALSGAAVPRPAPAEVANAAPPTASAQDVPSATAASDPAPEEHDPAPLAEAVPEEREDAAPIGGGVTGVPPVPDPVIAVPAAPVDASPAAPVTVAGGQVREAPEVASSAVQAAPSEELSPEARAPEAEEVSPQAPLAEAVARAVEASASTLETPGDEGAESAAVPVAGIAPGEAVPPFTEFAETAAPSVPLAALQPVILAPEDAGAALFTRAGRLIAVIERGSLPPGAQLAEGMTSASLPGGLVLTTRLPAPDSWPALERTSGGWRLVSGQTDTTAPIAVETAAEPIRLRLDLPMPGAVLAVPDPETGGTLLVGTQRGPAAALGQGRVFAEFRLLPSLRGVVLAPASDRIALRADSQGFEVLYSAPTEGTLALTDAPPVAADTAVRIFNFPVDDLAGLHERLRRQVLEAGAMPPLSRGRARADIAETMLALGLGPEARAALEVLASDDPQIGRSARVRALSAAAALIAGRAREARDLDDPALGGSDEITLWRAALAAAEGRTLPAGRASRAAARLLPLYPASLRARLAAPVAEALLAQGAREDAQAVLAALPAEPGLAFARAREREVAGDSDGALALYAPLAESRDRRVRALALRRIVEIRRASGALSAASAADALERQLLAWQGDEIERSLRIRIARLREEAGDLPSAIAGLRETIRVFPDSAQQLRPRIASMLAALAHDDGGMPPAAFVALVEANADALPQGRDGIALARQLADHLRALDLPDRAAAVYERLLPVLDQDEDRATVGLALAELRVEMGDGDAALAALAATAPATPPPDTMVIARGLAAARAELARGQPAAANRILDALPGTEAAIMRADQALREGAWEEARQRFAALLPVVAPDGRPADATARRIIVQCALAAARSGNVAFLGELKTRYGAALDGTEAEAPFRALTGATVADMDDLPGAARELAAMREVLKANPAPH